MSDVLYRAGDGWTDLKPLIETQVAHDRVVIWRSLSGTIQTFATTDGLLVRIRQAPGDSAFATDGMALVVERPWFATSCGLGDAAGYRSTPPLTVVAIWHPDDLEHSHADARDVARNLAAADVKLADLLGNGHPPTPCGAMNCPKAHDVRTDPDP